MPINRIRFYPPPEPEREDHQLIEIYAGTRLSRRWRRFGEDSFLANFPRVV